MRASGVEKTAAPGVSIRLNCSMPFAYPVSAFVLLSRVIRIVTKASVEIALPEPKIVGGKLRRPAKL